MTERAYTVSEIDALRSACEQRYLWGTTYSITSASGSYASQSYKESDKIAAVEQMVRTYMLGGITAGDIHAEDRARAEAYAAADAKYATAEPLP